MSVSAGTKFGYYEVISLLGRGGMGEVYLAHDTRLGRRIALKVLPSKYISQDDRVRRFQLEARAVSALNHPNIITIFEIGETEDSHFIATEYVEGQTLSQTLVHGPLNVAMALDIVIQAASALAAAHRAGIIHRDIKSDNIMLRPDGYVKVLDFGLAKLTEKFPSGQGSDPESNARAKNTTTPGLIMGTVNYMSPEQARGQKVDARSDIFSLGVVLYEMLVGQLPFVGDSGSDVIAAVLHQEITPPRQRRAELPAEFDQIVGTVLSKDRTKRYQTADEMIAALRRIRHQLNFQGDEGFNYPSTPSGSTEARGNSGRTTIASNSGATLIDPDTDQARTEEISHSQLPDVRDHTAQRKRVLRQSNLEYLVTSIRRHRRESILLIAALLLAVVAGVYYLKQQQIQPDQTIAVLPFINSDDEAKPYLDQITKRMIGNLINLPNLRVTPLISVENAIGGRSTLPDPRELGRQLDVSTILQGRVSRQTGDFRIDIDLIDTRNNSVLLSKQYIRKWADLPALDEKITSDVLEKLELNPTAKDVARLNSYKEYLKGRVTLSARRDFDLAIDQFTRAIGLDPEFALAYAALADAHNLIVTYGESRDPNASFEKAREAAERAIKLNPNLAEAHTALAYVKHRYDWDWEGARAEFRQAIASKEDYAPAHQWYSSLLIAMGRTSEAETEVRQCQLLDPLSLINKVHLAWVFYLNGKPKESLEAAKKVIADADNFLPAWRYAGLSSEQLGDYDQAIEAFNKALEIKKGSQLILGALGHVYAAKGDRDEAQQQLRELMEKPKYSAYEAAIIYTGLGEYENALNLLDRACTERNESVGYLMVDPRLKSLRSEARTRPRYLELLKKVRLSEN
jgi:serine/threonine protein kinase/tetratricopeptide (TPR) repeat protein